MWPFYPKSSYDQVPASMSDSQEDEPVKDSEEALSNNVLSSRGLSRKTRAYLGILISANAILFVVSVAILVASRRPVLTQGSASPLYRNRRLNSDLKAVSFYSPILDEVDLRPSLRMLNGALRDNTSIWRQPPSDAVDAAWDRISTEGAELITVSADEIAASGKDPHTSIRAPAAWREGTDAYLAQIDVFHQIHCLNVLRKDIFRDHYFSANEFSSELHRTHTAHCIHMLLQALMCQADVGLVSHYWVHNERIPEPKTRLMADFNVHKQCRDFDALLDWAEQRAVKDIARKWPLLRHQPGEPIMPGDGYA